ncbi:WhiB family transcription factor [Mycobacterium Phage Niklas]|uniref:WhiB family transcription factor n=1 Tax=Mycobacterium Phage Niklas TaxID=2517936 RepID=A0A482JGE9_9CAUD|nr:WhiB transcriptional factor [Mycobacterium Phage Niklas]ASR85937.1 WhiB family transcription factor [Mycobacterium phage Peanam]QAY02784.1 WhiB family transcription factor [Mycobacterium phage Shaobing]QBP31635.1 WhiB family transcription factor [Mycobacterium Phage Niklas]
MSADEYFGQPEAWEADALCAQVDPEIFFPEQGGSVREAKRVCGRCPVTDECLDRALSLPSNPTGVWGGTTERERRRMIRNARQEVAA